MPNSNSYGQFCMENKLGFQDICIKKVVTVEQDDLQCLEVEEIKLPTHLKTSTINIKPEIAESVRRALQHEGLKIDLQLLATEINVLADLII